MNAYAVFEFVVIALIVGFSADRVLGMFAPSLRQSLHRGVARRFGLKPADTASATGGCGSGCGSCGTGCGTGPVNPSASETEQPLQFRPRKV